MPGQQSGYNCSEADAASPAPVSRPGEEGMETIGFDEWKRLQLRVGEILEVHRIPKTDKLYRLKVGVGEHGQVQIVTSLVPYYSEDELQGQKIIVLVNLKPAQFAGEPSEGMLLCAEREDGSECVLLTVQRDIPPGTPIT